MQKSTRTRFSLATFPDAQHFQYFVLFLILGGASLFAPTVLPDVGKSSLDASLLQRIKKFEVKNDIQAGQFRSTVHEGDTKTSLDATFYGVSILTSARAKSHGLSLNAADRTKKWVSSLDPSNLQEIYEITVILKRLQALDNKKINDLYTKVLALAEQNSGFKLDVEHSTSARASYYAFQTIEELGKFNEFKNTENYKSTIEFVTNLRDENTGGYADSLGQNATLDATFYAFKILPSPKEGSEAFVLKTQRQDGGFANAPIADAYDFYSESDVATTARGIYVLEKCGVYSTYTFVDGSTYRAFSANSFLRYHMREKPNLEGIYQFFELVDTFPYIGYGTPRALELVFVGLGALFALLAVINFYQPQLPSDSLSGLYSAVVISAVLFGVGAAGVLFFPQLAVVTYVIAGFYLLSTYYQAQTIDTPEGVMVLIGSINSLIFLGVMVSLSFASPYIYAQTSVFYILFGLSIVSTLATSYGGAYFTPKQKINFFIRAGLLGWVTNVIVFFVFLYARGDMDFVFYLSLIRGTFPLIFVYFPLLSLVSSYFFSAVGYSLCAK